MLKEKNVLSCVHALCTQSGPPNKLLHYLSKKKKKLKTIIIIYKKLKKQNYLPFLTLTFIFLLSIIDCYVNSLSVMIGMVGESRLGVISYRRYEKMLYCMSSSICLCRPPPPRCAGALIKYIN